MQKRIAEPGPSSRKRDWIFALLLLATTFVAYRSAWNGLPVWDDDVHMTPAQFRSMDGLARAWTLPRGPVQYFPLVHTVFWVQAQLWGDSTLGYHLVSILLHVISALILVGILRKLGMRSAWLAAAVFALHPVMVESVAWISELKNTQSGVLFLSAFLAYLTFTENRKRGWYVSALSLFVLAMLSKTTIAPFPLAMLAVLWWRHGRLAWRRDLVPLLPFFLVAVSLGLVTLYVERSHTAIGEPELDFSLAERSLIAGRALWFYLGKVFVPVNLTISYPLWALNASAWWQYLFPGAALGMGSILWKVRRWSRAPMAAFFYFAAMLLPFLGLLSFYTFRYSFAADRYQYLAALGPMVVGVALLEQALERLGKGRKTAEMAIGAVLLSTLAILTWKQASTYSGPETLYRTTIARNGASWMAYSNLASAFDDLGREDEALLHYQKALDIAPGRADGHYNLGVLLAKMGRNSEALSHYQKALQIAPSHTKARNNLAVLLKAMGRTQEALDQYLAVLEKAPEFGDAELNLASLLEDMGRLDEALTHYQKALERGGNPAKTHYNLGLLLARMGRTDQAALHYRKAIDLDPNHADAHNNLGILLAGAGRTDEAARHFGKALAIRPDAVRFLKNLAVALVQKGESGEATSLLKDALATARSDGDDARAQMIAQILADLQAAAQK